MSFQKKYLVLLAFVLFGFAVRVASTYPSNTIVGFDQARDLFEAKKIYQELDLRIIGPTAGNNPNLHHGVAFLYFIIPPLILGGGNPFWVNLWISIFGIGTAVVLFYFAKFLFNDTKLALISSFLVSISYQLVQFSGWIGNPSPTVFTVPVYFLGLWRYCQGKKWGLPLGLFFLGLSIQFELFFLYLIPVFLIFWIIFRPPNPGLSLLIKSLLVFSISSSTMILTEIKFKFSGVSTIISDILKKEEGKAPFQFTIEQFFKKFWETFSLNLWPQNPDFGKTLGIVLIGFLLVALFREKSKPQKKALKFVLLYLLSPFLLLFGGFHAAPWFLIGLTPAVILVASFAISKIPKVQVTFLILFLLAFVNLKATKEAYTRGQPLLEPDQSALLFTQLSVIDYTYKEAFGKPFAINTLTNPLYINAVWAYNYGWYGKNRYGYLPGWLGGDQLPPYDLLPKSEGEESLFFLITDQSPRIPYVHLILAERWASENGRLVEEQNFPGIKVSVWERRPS